MLPSIEPTLCRALPPEKHGAEQPGVGRKQALAGTRLGALPAGPGPDGPSRTERRIAAIRVGNKKVAEGRGIGGPERGRLARE